MGWKTKSYLAALEKNSVYNASVRYTDYYLRILEVTAIKTPPESEPPSMRNPESALLEGTGPCQNSRAESEIR